MSVRVTETARRPLDTRPESARAPITPAPLDLQRGSGRRLATVVGVIVSAVVLGGCIFPREVAAERRPTVVGVIADSRVNGANDLIVKLEDGREVILPDRSERLTAGSNGDPGALLLADPTATQPWFVSPLPQSSGCFVISTPFADLHRDEVVLANGLVVPLAPDFQAGPELRDNRIEHPHGIAVCLDDQGRALSATG